MELIKLLNAWNALKEVGIGNGYLIRRGNGKKRGGMADE
jgi:hypothetical protein